MDFFQRQKDARKRMYVLAAYFSVAIVLVIPPVYLVALGISIPFRATYNFFGAQWDFHKTFVPLQHPGWRDPPLFLWVTAGIVLVLACGAAFMVYRAACGGAVLAQMLGGVEVSLESKDPRQRRLLNVVEEMALACGLPIPDVYLIHAANGINAFAAGLTPRDSAIGVTPACMEVLSREELQGVIAHEFSHILHGDMRLKTIMLCMLHGLSLPGAASIHILRDAVTGESTHAALLVGALVVFSPLILPFLLVSRLGLWLADAVKSAVSKQQEFVADAAAVQFTRNPAAVAGALKKVGGYAAGTRVLSVLTREMSHFFFAEALGEAPTEIGLLAMHPPLEERVRRIDPSFDGTFPYVPSLRKRELERIAEVSAQARGEMRPPLVIPAHVEQLVESIGSPQPESLLLAGTLLAVIPPVVREAMQTPSGAASVAYAQLLSADEAIRAKQLVYLASRLDPEAHRALLALSEALRDTSSAHRLPIAKLAIHSLRKLPRAAHPPFLRDVEALVLMDAQVDLFERALQGMLRRHLPPAFGHALTPGGPIVHYRMAPLLPACEQLLSCLVRWGSHDEDKREFAFRKGAEQLEGGETLAFRPSEDSVVDQLNHALETLARAGLALKKQILSACIVCVTADGRISVAESEMLQIIGDALDCPLPPVTPTAA